MKQHQPTYRLALAMGMCLAMTAQAQTLTTRTGEGASLKTDFGYDIVLNKNSSLKRQWTYIQDANSPVDVEGTPDVMVAYIKDYKHTTYYSLKAKQDLTAVEVIHVVFDVFGQRLHTLQNVEVADIKAGESVTMTGEWRIWSERDARVAHTSFTYIRSARTASGNIYTAPSPQVFDVIKKSMPTLLVSDIEPKKQEPK